MQKALLTLLPCVLACAALAQGEGDPCCAIVGIHAAKNLVMMRDNTTGRLYQFSASAQDIQSFKLNDPVTANAQRSSVSKIAATARSYKAVPVNSIKSNISAASQTANTGNTGIKGVFQPDYGEPCCNVVNIQLDNGQPCCAIVSAKHKSNGKTFRFTVPANIATGVQTGDPVFAGPINSIAIIQQTESNSGQLAAYGYPIESGDGSGKSQDNDQFVITPADGMKGALGRLNLKFPADVTWELDVRTADDKFITHKSQNDTKAFLDLAPGTYMFRLSRVPVQGVIPIEKGKETRLKSGILHIVSNGNWSLYDETKKKFYTTSGQKMKFPIPAGNYILQLGGQDLPITIKDGETLEM